MSPTPSNASLPHSRGKSPISEVLSLPLLHLAQNVVINEQPPANTTMVKFTSLSSTLMYQGKLNSSSFEKDTLTGTKPDNLVPDDEDQMNIQLTTSDIKLEERPMVLESVGSNDELMVMQTSPGAAVNKRERSKDSFCSSEFGPIISAAQSTALLYSATELTRSVVVVDTSCNCSSENSRINLHGFGFLYYGLVRMHFFTHLNAYTHTHTHTHIHTHTHTHILQTHT